MANDRIFLRCPKCGEEKLILAYFPSWTGRGPSEDFAAWADSHIKECGKIFSGDLNGDPFFKLTTESDGPRDYTKKDQRIGMTTLVLDMETKDA